MATIIKGQGYRMIETDRKILNDFSRYKVIAQYFEDNPKRFNKTNNKYLSEISKIVINELVSRDIPTYMRPGFLIPQIIIKNIENLEAKLGEQSKNPLDGMMVGLDGEEK
jgi:hypothetical protein